MEDAARPELKVTATGVEGDWLRRCLSLSETALHFSYSYFSKLGGSHLGV